MSKLGVAVLGLGFGMAHLREYHKRNDVEVRAIGAGSNEERMKKAQQEYNIAFASTDYRKVLDRDDVDIVSICSPDHFHAEQILYALEHGKHVLVEKPMATTKEDALKIARLVDRSDLKLMVGQNYRFTPAFKAMREIAGSGDLGEIFLLEGDYVQDCWSMVDLGPQYWRFKAPQDFFIGGAVHLVDFLKWLGGDIEEVHSYANHRLPLYPLNENYVTSLKFKSGALGRVLMTLSCRVRPSFQVKFTAYGTKGTAIATNFDGRVRLYVHGMVEGQNDFATIPVDAGNSLRDEIGHFIDCVINDKKPLIDARDGANTVALCADAVRSANEGLPVKVERLF